MQESCPYGSVRGAPSNGCPYRNRKLGLHHAGVGVLRSTWAVLTLRRRGPDWNVTKRRRDSERRASTAAERGIEKTDELRRLKNARNRKFESISLQQTVRLSSAVAFEGREPGFRRGFARMAWRPRRQRRRDVLISLRRAAMSLSGRIPVPQ